MKQCLPFVSWFFLFLFALALEAGSAQTIETSGPTSDSSTDGVEPKTTTAAAANSSKGNQASKKQGSPAEKITGISRLLQADRQRETELEKTLSKLEDEFQKASDQSSGLEARVAEQKTRVNSALSDVEKAEEQLALNALEKERAQGRDRFDHVIKRRKAYQQQLDVLQEKLAVEEAALEHATSPDAKDDRSLGKASSKNTGTVASNNSPGGTTPAGTGASFSNPTTATPSANVPAPSANAAAAGPPASVLLPTGTASTAGDGSLITAVPASNALTDERVAKARKELAEKQAVKRDAEQQLVQRDRAIDVFQRDIESSKQLLELAREDVKTAQAAVQMAEVERRQRVAAKAEQEELDDLQHQTDEAQRELQAAEREAERQSTRLEQSESLLKQLQQGRETIVQSIEKATSDAESAQLSLQFLESPLAPHRLMRWVMRAGPRVVAILAALVGFWWLSGVVARRLVRGLLLRSVRGTHAERESRAETLRRVFQSTASSVIVCLGVLALLDQAGVNVTVFLGGAAVIGAAVAFGSQNLIKDYFSGFMILVENQYSVGNVVSIGNISGQVEDITLRMTALRDEAGVVHFLPHSQVTIVSNMTHGWSRAVMKVAVGYDEDIDHAMQVLTEVARELANDEAYRDDILGEPEMLGVDELAESAVIIKFLVKTRPLTQWNIKRELLKRIKHRFDEVGIGFPYPTQVVQVLEPSSSLRHGNDNDHSMVVRA